MARVSIVIPACNEAAGIAETVRGVGEAFRRTGHEYEIIVVDDGSTDNTAVLAAGHARVITHPTNKGYGNSLLTGVRNARHPWIAITDADGTYPVEQLPAMLDCAIERDLDMAIGARQGRYYFENTFKRAARFVFRHISQWVVGEPIPDINSGMRIMRREMIAAFAPALSGGFSFTTSITIMAFQTGHHVAYIPVDYHPRKGDSHVRLWRDTKRALQIIVMTIVLFNPIKLYLLAAFAVLAYTITAILFTAVFPGLESVIFLASLGFFTSSVIMTLGFLGLRNQINLNEIALPQRGYAPQLTALPASEEAPRARDDAWPVPASRVRADAGGMGAPQRR